jgi:hypothetical protein
MLKEFENNLDFSEIHTLSPWVKLPLHPLYCNNLIRVIINCLPDTPIRAITQLLHNLVPAHVNHADSYMAQQMQNFTQFLHQDKT